jgi:hypothetical protein
LFLGLLRGDKDSVAVDSEEISGRLVVPVPGLCRVVGKWDDAVSE